MSDANVLYYGPINYSSIWLVLGIVFLLAAAAIVAVIFYVTRKKPVKKLSTLEVKAPKVVNMNVLRDKYIKLINEAEIRYKKRQIKASQCHQQISLLVRLFFYEAMGFHADIMTLSDLKKSNYKKLTKLVEEYYPDEFNTLEKGSVAKSAENARELVRSQ